MDKTEFIWQLNQMLADLPEEERAEAVSYYEEYLEDAGLEQEAQTLEELGSPEQVAAIIRENLYGDLAQGGVYTETGYHGATENDKKLELDRFTQIVSQQTAESEGAQESAYQSETMADRDSRENKADKSFYQKERSQETYTDSIGNHTKTGGKASQNRYSGQRKKEGMSGETKALLIILALLFSIALAEIAVAVIAVIISVMVTIFGVAVSFVAITGACLVTGVVLVVIGIANIVSASPAGILLCGLGFLFFGVGMLFLIATAFVFKTILPMLAKGFVSLCRLPFQKGENMA